MKEKKVTSNTIKKCDVPTSSLMILLIQSCMLAIRCKPLAGSTINFTIREFNRLYAQFADFKEFKKSCLLSAHERTPRIIQEKNV